MSKASEQELAELHGVVAKELKKVIEGEAATAAHFGAAIAFLKNNSITADASKDEGLKELSDALTRRRQQKKQDFREAAEAFGKSLGDSPSGLVN